MPERSLISPTLPSIIRQAIERRVSGIHTAMPAEIVKYDFARNLAQVKPAFTIKFVTEDVPREIPIISDVPVLIYRTSGAHVRLPIAPGDTGLLIFAERSIDRWIDGLGANDPKDGRKHDLSDAVFAPGLFPITKPMDGSSATTSVEIRNQSGFMEFSQSGRFRIGNLEEELLSLLKEIVNALQSITITGTTALSGGETHTHAIIAQPETSSVISAFAALEARMAKLKG